jgi:hypothetical protein
MRSPNATAAIGYQGLIQLVLALASATVTVFLIRENLPFRTLIIVAALAGVTGAMLTPYAPGFRFQRNRIDFAFVLYNLLIGLGAGGGGFLIASSLLVGRVVSGAASNFISPIGTAAFGLIVGIAAGRAARFVTATLENASGKVGTLGTLGAAAGYIDSNIQERLFGPKLVNFDGLILAEWHPTTRPVIHPDHPQDTNRPITLGHVRVQLMGSETEIPTSGHIPINVPDAQPPPTDQLVQVHARLRIDGGEPAKEAPFTITFRGYIGEVFPTRIDIMAPVRGSSEVSEFTFLRAPVDNPLHMPDDYPDEFGSVLIDISQAGSTVQLLELPLPL